MTDSWNDPDVQRKRDIEEADIAADEEREQKQSAFVDTAATKLIRTANDVLVAINKLDLVGIEMSWQLELMWLGDASDMGDYHAAIWGTVPGYVWTEYLRRRSEHPERVPRMPDRKAVLLTMQQVDAIVEAAEAVRKKTD